MTTQTQLTLQKTYILATGTAANASDLAVLDGMVTQSGSFGSVDAAVDAYIGGLTARQGAVATVQAIVMNGFGVTLTAAQAQQGITDLVAAGIDSPSKLLNFLIALQGTYGTTLDNRAQAASSFLDTLNLAGNSAYFTGIGASNAVYTLLQNIDSSSVSLTNGISGLNVLATNLTATGITGDGYTLTADAPIITEIMAGASVTKALTFTLTLGSVPTGEVTVNYATQTSGSATSNTDFVAATGTVTFAAGQTIANVTIVVNDDATAEADETVAVLFSSASLVAPVTGTGTILANDTPGLTVVLTAGTDTPVLGPNDDTINSTQSVPVQLDATDIVAGSTGTDTLTITPTIDTAFTLNDAIFSQVSGIDRIVIADTGTGGQTITTAGLFQAAFGTAGVDLQTTATTAATGTGMVVNLSAVTGPLTLTTTTTTGAQTITTGNGNATVFATASTGAVGITTGTGADVVTLTTSADTDGPGCAINTGAGNDIITIVLGGAAATSMPNLITGGLGADTITLSNDAEWNNIVIGNTDSGITLAGADSITGFVAATDTLKMGTAAAVTGAATTDNYVEAGVAVADFAAALSAANIQLAALALATTGALEAYAFQWVAGTNGYLFNDTDGSGTADQVVVLVGIIDTTISNVDIIA